ncbi:MAG: 4-hydroxybenzoate octaprenyltransferase [Alphaproteobacteria bacterium]|nr:4-hydroxybenzoate octaprenyltransferase [Alphaproteobacteria bacterium]
MPDTAPNDLFLRFAPHSWIPFIQLMRLDRPIGWWLLLLPCWWSAALAGIANGQGANWLHVLLFLAGAIVMRGAGSTWNDLIDRHIDAQVERTRARPLPSGRVSVRAAKIFLAAQLAAGALVLLTFNWFAVATGIASLAIVAIYPYMKRFTFWPQAVLGLAFAWGGLMGWAAAFGSLAWPALLIYAAAIFWTIGYDTIYALQDARDDAIVGVRSTARLFARNVRAGVAFFYVLALASAAGAVWLAGGGLAAFSGLAAFGLHLAWQVSVIRTDDPALALRLFRANRDAGLILFAGLALQGLLR